MNNNLCQRHARFLDYIYPDIALLCSIVQISLELLLQNSLNRVRADYWPCVKIRESKSRRREVESFVKHGLRCGAPNTLWLHLRLQVPAAMSLTVLAPPCSVKT